jgi:hypothetical protein
MVADTLYPFLFCTSSRALLLALVIFALAAAA